MSRLDSMLRRLTAQRDGLTWATRQIEGRTGDVLDLGLGNGRTYDHLREQMPDRRIWVIDRVLQCHPSCVPPAEDFLEGEADQMLTQLAESGRKMVLAHYDLAKGVEAEDAAEAARLSPYLARLMLPDGLIISGQALVGFREISGPDTIPEDRYFFYRA
jgi:hypothetical protein